MAHGGHGSYLKPGDTDYARCSSSLPAVFSGEEKWLSYSSSGSKTCGASTYTTYTHVSFASGSTIEKKCSTKCRSTALSYPNNGCPGSKVNFGNGGRVRSDGYVCLTQKPSGHTGEKEPSKRRDLSYVTYDGYAGCINGYHANLKTRKCDKDHRNNCALGMTQMPGAGNSCVNNCPKGAGHVR